MRIPVLQFPHKMILFVLRNLHKQAECCDYFWLWYPLRPVLIDLLDLIPELPSGVIEPHPDKLPIRSSPSAVSKSSRLLLLLFQQFFSKCHIWSAFLPWPLRVSLKSLLLNGSVHLSEGGSQPSPFSFLDLQDNPQLSGFFPQPLILYSVG